MMTRKNFEAIADVIRGNVQAARRRGSNDEHFTLWSVSEDLADIFADDNPNFDRDRFMKACGF